MGSPRITFLAAAVTTCVLTGACGTTAPASSTTSATDSVIKTRVSSSPLAEWPEFGLDPQRSDTSMLSSGITAASLGHLKRLQIDLPGTVNSSPIYLHAVSVAGSERDVVILTTTYGKTLALDAADGRILWTFTPPHYSQWAGSAQITTASPLADPDHEFVFAASPDGRIHKLSLSDGHEDASGAWPVRVTLDPTHEKIAAALNIDGPDVLAATGGYLGDAPPYQGHLVAIDRSSGRIQAVYNTLCANRRGLQIPSTCPASDSAILSRSGAVVEPGGKRILIDTGNAPWNGSTDFGDSVLELTFPTLTLRQSFTPVDQEMLNTGDGDLGSSAPALLGANRAVLAGKDGIMRVLDLARLDGRAPGGAERLGGEVQTLTIPGGGELFTTPAVLRQNGHTTMFVADENATGAYVLHAGKLHLSWQNSNPGTSPVLVGGLLYVYDPSSGAIYVYRPSSPRPLVKLPGEPGHWNSPIVVAGHLIVPQGDANEHKLTGKLEIFSTG